jgi:signal transduction histidine kinase
MKHHPLEPGLLQVLKFLALFQVLGIFILRLPVGAAMGVEVTLVRWLWLSLSGLFFLVIYTWIPWWQKRLGRVYVPLFLAIASIHLILEKYLTLFWFTSPEQQELVVLLLIVKLWFSIQLIALLVAWQYSRAAVLWVSLGLCIADGVLSLPFVMTEASLYTLAIYLLLARAAAVTLVAVGVQWLVDRQRQQRAALTEANRKLARYAATSEQLAASQERNRLARELHDTLAHSLSGVTVQLEAVEALWEVKPREARTILDRARQATQNGLTEARRALGALRASPLEDIGLALAVRDLAKSAAARACLQLDLDAQDHLTNLAPEVEQCVYRVAQEALTNVARHADAKSLRVSLRYETEGLTLIIADDGRGFEPAEVDGAHYGLQGLRERAEMLGAVLQVESRSQEGTTVRLVVPTTPLVE